MPSLNAMPLVDMEDWSDVEMDVVRGEADLNKLTIPVLREQLEARGLTWKARERKAVLVERLGSVTWKSIDGEDNAEEDEGGSAEGEGEDTMEEAMEDEGCEGCGGCWKVCWKARKWRVVWRLKSLYRCLHQTYYPRPRRSLLGGSSAVRALLAPCREPAWTATIGGKRP